MSRNEGIAPGIAEGITVEFKILVDNNGNAQVTMTPTVAKLRKDTDYVVISSNDPKTAIRYRGTSPFLEPEVAPDQVLLLDGKKGPFKCVTLGDTHHFDCGRIINGNFQRWGRTQGASTPVGPKGN